MCKALYFLGIDFGTSGVRAIAIDGDAHIQATTRCDYGQTASGVESSNNQSSNNQSSNKQSTDKQSTDKQSTDKQSTDKQSIDGEALPEIWRQALIQVMQSIPLEIRQHLRAIAINGTSGTVLWCDDQGTPVAPPLLYNDDRGQSVLGILRAIAPQNHVVLSSTSSLAKLIWWTCQSLMMNTADNGMDRFQSIDRGDDRLPAGYFLHQADWLAFLLHGKLGISDYHNSLKLGYDVEALAYPQWMQTIPTRLMLPTVVAPGTPVSRITSTWVSQFNLPEDCQVCAGTTDSIAAFLASGAEAPGEAVTSLGSTLVIKLLSTQRVNASQHGIYSHRLDVFDNGSGQSCVRWLVGGASNTGGAVLRQFFSDEDLQVLGDRLNPHQESLLDYYPLCQPGERFPINDPHLSPRLSPRPDDDAEFLHGLLESMARIEAQGFQRLAELGSTPLNTVFTAGGGAQNAAWSSIRQRRLGVPVLRSPQTEAAYGTACLALKGASD